MCMHTIGRCAIGEDRTPFRGVRPPCTARCIIRHAQHYVTSKGIEMADPFELTVFGTAEPAGSKKAVPLGRGGMNPHRYGVVDANPRAGKWKVNVSQHAGLAMQNRKLLEGPLTVTFTFFVKRPKGHYGVHGVRRSAPPFPDVRPDVLKLARAVEDALSGVVYRDDAQIVDERLVKRYGEPERVEIRIESAMPAIVPAEKSLQLGIGA